MKYIYVITVLLVLCILVEAQTPKTPIVHIDSTSLLQKSSFRMSYDPYKNYTPKIIRSSPLSQLFEQYINHPITEYNGLPKIEIPLYEIELNGMTIPITLSYHAGGIQYNQYPGEVGLGWSIGATGHRVTRTMNNKPDESAQHVDFSYIKKYQGGDSYNNALRDTYLAGLSPSKLSDGGADYTTRIKHVDKDVDGEYDLFTYMSPTTSNRFILDVDLFSNHLSVELATIDDTRDKLGINGKKLSGVGKQEMSRILNTFEIVDEQGNQFYFGSNDNQFKETTYQSNDIISGQYSTFTSAWMLEKAITNRNDIVKFTYDDYSIPITRHGTSRQMIIYDPIFMEAHGGSPYEALLDTWNSPSESYNVKMLKTILATQETVSIEREKTGDSRGRIKQITVRSKATNAQIRNIVFSYENGYDYLLSKIAIYGSDNTNAKVYSFEYYNDQPSKYYYPDHWGYNTPDSKFDGFHYEFHSDKYVHKWYDYRYDARPLSGSYNRYVTTFRKTNTNPSRLTLKRTNYPTGGYTEYIYERHKYFDNESLTVEGGGLRIKKIISDPRDGTLPISTEYQYTTGIPTFNLNHRDFATEHYILETFGVSLGYSLQTKRIYSTTPLGDLSWGLFSVNYPKVTKLEYEYNPQTNVTKYNGKIESEYTAGSLYTDGNGIYTITTFLTNEGVRGTDFTNSTYPYPRYISEYNFANMPKILNQTHFNSEGKKLLRTEYKYKLAKNKATYFKGLKISQRFFSRSSHLYTYYSPDEVNRILQRNKDEYIQLVNTYIDPFALRGGFFDYGEYSYKINYNLLSEQKTITYIENDNSPVIQQDQYFYDDLNRLLSKSTTNSEGGLKKEAYTYPNATREKALVEKNMLSTIVQTNMTHNYEAVGVVKTEYSTNSINPIAVKYSASDINQLQAEIFYNQYDSKGNLLQYTGKDDIPVFYIWSYNYQYPIAEIRNATNMQVETAVKNTFSVQSIDILARMNNPDENNIRRLCENVNLKDALVSSYTYKPFVGMTSETDPLGITTYYEYDSFNRLKRTYIKEKDSSGKDVERDVQKYEYNYQNR